MLFVPFFCIESESNFLLLCGGEKEGQIECGAQPRRLSESCGITEQEKKDGLGKESGKITYCEHLKDIIQTTIFVLCIVYCVFVNYFDLSGPC